MYREICMAPKKTGWLIAGVGERLGLFPEQQWVLQNTQLDIKLLRLDISPLHTK